jgi:hypothetical protein
MWYNEYIYYSYSFPGYSTSTGHFTQVIWKSSQSIGCGLAINGTKVYGVTNCKYTIAYIQYYLIF